MRLREPIIYAVLLVLALGFAYRTWAREDVSDSESEGVAIWEESPEELVWVEYEAEDLSVRLERRGAGDDSYFWGTVIRTRPTYRRVNEDSTVREETVDTIRFVAGDRGDELVETLAVPRVLRDLGVLDDAGLEEYALADSTARLTVGFGEGESGAHELRIGGEVYGSADHYALAPAAGRAYALPGDALELLEDAATRLPERGLHEFDRDNVATVVVEAGGRESTRLREDGATPGEETWTAPGAPDRPDQTFANFIERLRRLWVDEYMPEVDVSVLERLARIEYFDADDDLIGYFELYRGPGGGESEAETGDSEEEPEYILRTELTRVPATTYGRLAEDVARDLEQLFSGESEAAAAASI